MEAIVSGVSKNLERGALCQPRRTLSRMHTMNYTRFIWENDLLKKYEAS